MKQSINRIYHPHYAWEEVKYNMWGTTPDKMEMLEWAIKFTGNHKLYGEWMMKVAKDWTHSCEHNLSNTTQNRKAWIGHAACAYAKQCPEDIVRKAWGYLTEEQQNLANGVANDAIRYWEDLQWEKENLA